ncbi:MAG TPA: acyl-CoA desaturase [Jatrophihabitans sp.]|uniref:fatty acid desaturase family protein n=1 Tax=Jatrophihabitans sp. TaxID=1932789 RepID=UPI002F15A939
MTATTQTARGSDFAVLCRQVRAANLLQRRGWNYAVRISVTLLAFLALCAGFVLAGDTWYQLGIAVALGLASTQLAFLGHDGGHQQVCRSRRANDLIGLLIGDLLVGLSFGWWLDKHNRHHANPNHEDHDPDIGDSVLAFTTAHIAGRTGGPLRFIARHQAWLFFPMLCFEGLQLHVASVRSLIQGKQRRYRRIESVLLSAHLVGYLGGIFLVLSPLKALAFIAVHQAIFGIYMGCSFAPNHKGMAIIAPGEQLDFLRRQVLTSRNVRGGWFTDLLLGGLNYQIEHHLFPNMPRPNLRKAQRLVFQYCQEHHISYTETSLVGSYAAALGYLHRLGAPLRGTSPS